MEQTWDNIPDQYTADGVKIVPGLAVWNQNYSSSLTDDQKDKVVAPDRWGNTLEPIWFTTNQGFFDGSRLSVRRPW